MKPITLANPQQLDTRAQFGMQRLNTGHRMVILFPGHNDHWADDDNIYLMSFARGTTTPNEIATIEPLDPFEWVKHFTERAKTRGMEIEGSADDKMIVFFTPEEEKEGKVDGDFLKRQLSQAAMGTNIDRESYRAQGPKFANFLDRDRAPILPRPADSHTQKHDCAQVRPVPPRTNEKGEPIPLTDALKFHPACIPVAQAERPHMPPPNDVASFIRMPGMKRTDERYQAWIKDPKNAQGSGNQ